MGSDPLPASPSGLGPQWVRNPKHCNPKSPEDGKWTDGDGNSLEFNKGQPGMPRERGKDHWHFTPKEGEAVDAPAPGSDVPVRIRASAQEPICD